MVQHILFIIVRFESVDIDTQNSFYGVTDRDFKSVIGTCHTLIEGNLCFSNS
jgi:hypothetical protein